MAKADGVRGRRAAERTSLPIGVAHYRCRMRHVRVMIDHSVKGSKIQSGGDEGWNHKQDVVVVVVVMAPLR